MNKKKKILIALFISIIMFLAAGVTYSMFHSETELESVNSNIASFVFNDESLGQIDVNIDNLYPGNELEYQFYISNNKNNKISDTKIMYQLTIKTYHFIPLNISLYKIVNNSDILVGVCDETYSRNSNNELVCNMPIEELDKENKKQNNYKLKVEFPSEYSGVEYSNLADFIRLEIKSYQKM